MDLLRRTPRADDLVPPVRSLSLSGHRVRGRGGERQGERDVAQRPVSAVHWEDDYLWALERVLAAVGDAFRPQVLVTQLGADTHHGDPLANLGLTMTAYPPMAGLFHDFAHRHAGD